MLIRLATPDDADAISSLIAESTHHFTVDPTGRGAERFLQGISPQAIRGYITDPAFRYWVAVLGTETVGAAALRDGRHLFHLFVSSRHRRQGIARALWSSIRACAVGVGEITVNSSPNALAVYERFGFAATGPRSEANGIAFVPMKFTAAAAGPQGTASSLPSSASPRGLTMNPPAFVASHARDAVFERGLRSFFEYRDLGIRDATGGKVVAHVIRSAAGQAFSGQPHLHRADFQLVYVLKGWIEFEYEGQGVVRLEAGSCVHQPPGIRHRELGHSEDIEMLEVVLPGDFQTEEVPSVEP